MPIRHQQSNIKITNIFFSFTQLIQWAISNPVQAMVAILAIQSVLVAAKKAPYQPKDTNPEVSDITELLDLHLKELETQDVTQNIAVKDVTSVYQARNLKTIEACHSSLDLPDTAEAWALTLGGTGMEYGNAVAVAPDGSIMLTGSSSSLSIIGGGNTDVLLAKFAANGILSWAKTLGGFPQAGVNLVIRPNGNTVLLGSSFVSNPDVLVAEFLDNGNLAWAVTLNQYSDYGHSIALGVDGSIVLTGVTQYGIDSNILIAKLSANGTLSWAYSIGGNQTDIGNSIALSPDGSIVLAGYTQSFGAGKEDALLALFNANGTLSWAKAIGGVKEDKASDVVVRQNGDILLTGYSSSFNLVNYEVLLAQFTTHGALSWAKSMQEGLSSSLIMRPNGNIVLAGYSYTQGAGNTDILLTEFVGNGTLSWAKVLGGPAEERGFGLALTPDGSIVITGHTSSYGAGSTDILLLKLNTGNAINSIMNVLDISTQVLVNDISGNITINSINPLILNITGNLTQQALTSHTINSINNTAITPLSINTDISSWQQPLNALLKFKYSYSLPSPLFFNAGSHAALNVDFQGLDWLSYDANTQTISGTPIIASKGQHQILITPDIMVMHGKELYFGGIMFNLCISSLDEIDNVKVIGATNNEAGNSLAIRSDGSVVLAGYFGTSGGDVLIAEFTPNGTLSWAKTFGGSFYDWASSLVFGLDGSMVLTGGTESFGVGSYDVLIAKLTANGTLSWAKTLGSSYDDRGYSVAVQDNNNIVLAGTTQNSGLGTIDILLAQFTSNGTLSWAKTVGGNGNDWGNSLALLPDGNIALLGTSSSFGDLDLLLAKLTANGSLSWAKTLTGVGYEEGSSLAVRSDGNIMLTGYTSSYGGAGDVLLAEFSGNGTLAWAKTIGGPSTERAYSMAIRPDGAIVLTGVTFNYGNADVFIAQLSVDGTLDWARSFGGGNFEQGNSLVLRPDGGIIIAGHTQSFGNGYDILLARLNSIGKLEFKNTFIRDVPAQVKSVTPTVSNITSLLNISSPVNIRSQDWLLLRNSEITMPSSYGAGYFSADIAAFQLQPFNEMYTLNLGSALIPNVAILRLVELNKATLPSWLQYDSIRKVLSGTPTGAIRGDYVINMNLQQYEQQQELSFIIHVVNTVPYYMGNTTFNTPSGRFIFPLANYFKDNESDRIGPYGITELNGQLPPTIASIDAYSGRLFGTSVSGDQGQYQFNITAIDTHNGVGWQIVTINIKNADPIPNILFSNPFPVTEGNTFSFSFDKNAFVDPDNDAINYSAIYPDFLNYDPNTRTLFGAPQAENRGLHNFTLIARDSYGGNANVTLILDVNGVPVKKIALNSLVTSPVGFPYAYTLPSDLYVDPDGDMLIYQLIEDTQHSKPSWLSFNVSSNTLHALPTSNSHQPLSIRFVVSDGRGGSAYFDVSLNVPNSVPRSLGITNQTISVNQVRSLVITSNAFIDPDFDHLSYSLELVSGASQSWFSIANEVITFTPKSGDQGTYEFKLIARDSYSGQASAIFAVTVPNHEPTQTYPIPLPANARSRQLWSYGLDADNFADADRDELTYFASQANGSALPNWIRFNSLRRSFEGIPSGIDRGTFVIKIHVNDGLGGEVSGYFNATVINSAPVPDGRVFDQQVSAQESVFTIMIPTFTDPDDDLVTYSAGMLDGSLFPTWLHFNHITRTFTAFPSQATAGNYLIDVTATDTLGLSQSVSFNLVIQAVPNINLNSNQTDELLKSLLPSLGGAALLLIITGLLMCRQRRIHSTREFIGAWSNYLRPKANPSRTILFPSLVRDVQVIGEKLLEGADLAEIEDHMSQFERRLRAYYTQSGKHIPMTALLDLQIVEKLIKYVERNILELSEEDCDSDQTLAGARLLHSFVGVILSEHTGRGHKLTHETKDLYFQRLKKLLGRLNAIEPEDVAILFELESVQEAFICIADTNTLGLLCQASAAHILSLGALFADLRKLAFDIPSRWYKTLLELKLEVNAAQIDISTLSRMQQVAAKQDDWRFFYGMAPILIDIITNSQNIQIRKQAIQGRSSYLSIQLLGLIHLLTFKRMWVCWWKNEWVSRHASYQLNQKWNHLKEEEMQMLSSFALNSTLGNRRPRISLIQTPLDQGLSRGQEIDEASHVRMEVVNPLYHNALVSSARALQSAPMPK
jgi:uncharacterized delta-60 repeat protein